MSFTQCFFCECATKICFIISLCNGIEKHHIAMTLIFVCTPVQAAISSLIRINRAMIKRQHAHTHIGYRKLWTIFLWQNFIIINIYSYQKCWNMLWKWTRGGNSVSKHLPCILSVFPHCNDVTEWCNRDVSWRINALKTVLFVQWPNQATNAENNKSSH